MADLDIAAFLRVRLDEREAENSDPLHVGSVHAYSCDLFEELGEKCTCGVPALVLADVAAKRQIIELHRITYPGPDEEPIYGNHWEHVNVYNDDGSIRGDREFCVENDEPDPPRYCVACHDECTTLPLLALPYAGHPQYREEWKP